MTGVAAGSRPGGPMAPGWIVYPGGEGGGTCDCCGKTSRLIRGTAEIDGYPADYSPWTVGGSRRLHPPNFVLGGGGGDSGAGAEDDGTGAGNAAAGALAVSPILFEDDEGSSGVMVIDAADRPFANDPGLGAALLSREEVLGTPLALSLPCSMPCG